ncbi:haloacid dehalogenase-like hydrolase, putative [Plasmodium ovale]|uniref:Haloacid dehalogenase-like hydrolase, putative n=1 Tax=Plasmodium ovale TaxID=36330 RepID=A0A1C3L5F2_PLAOA|nr:haloacid dehalogenase-like hydrolase, putative [Plasmodium ovale]
MLKYKDSDVCLDNLLRKNGIKLIAIDIDGTLADDNGKISDDNLNAIQIAKKLGLKVILATGRLQMYALKMFSEKQKEEYKVHTFDGIFSHGAYLNMKGYNYLLRKFSVMDLELVLFALSTYKLLKNAIFLTVDSAYVFNDDINAYHYTYTHEYEGVKSSIKYINIIDKSYKAIQLNTIKEIFTIGDIVSVEIYGKLYPEQELYKDLFTVLFHELENHFKIYIPACKDKLVISPLNTAKVHGIYLMSQFYDIHMNEILSIGNDFNDVELLATSGYSVALKNSTAAASKVARCISTRTNNENAVANIIYRTITERRA